MEMLRILAMVMVIMLHSLAGSGALYEQEGFARHVYWWMEALSVCAVDVFVLISGYFLSDSSFRLRSLFRILAVTWAWSLPFSLAAALLAGEPLGTADGLKLLFPILTKKYWFVNAYLALYLLSPFLNRLLRSLRKEQFAVLLWIELGLMILRPTVFPKTWAQDVTGGLSVFFFIALYCIAAWVRRYGAEWKLTPHRCLLAYGLLSLLPVLARAGLVRLGVPEETASRYYSYDSAIVVLEALALFLTFLRARPRTGRRAELVNAVARYSFAAYIIHYAMNGILWRRLLGLDRFVGSLTTGPAAILLSSVLVFLLCAALEFARSKAAGRLRQALAGTRLLAWEDRLVQTWDRRMDTRQ